jgi:hypothetical protein
MGKIIWLASYPKSGNTWLRAFLHNLMRDPDQPYDINKLSHFSISDSAAGWYQAIDPRPVETLTKEEVQQLRPRVHESMTRAHPDSVFVKTHNALVEDRGVQMVTMEYTAGAIYVVRNPLDVVISHSSHYGIGVDESIRLTALDGLEGDNEPNYVYEHHGSWSKNVKSWTRTPHPGLLVVRYEDMSDQPHETFGRVAGFLGLKPPRERLHKAIRQSSFRALREQEEKHGFVERSVKSGRFFREGRAGQWREILTPAQIEAVVGAHREQMARFGYWPLPEKTAEAVSGD